MKLLVFFHYNYSQITDVHWNGLFCQTRVCKSVEMFSMVVVIFWRVLQLVVFWLTTRMRLFCYGYTVLSDGVIIKSKVTVKENVT